MVSSMDAQDLSAVQNTVLKAFSNTLGFEDHNLESHPDIIWQSLYNIGFSEGKAHIYLLCQNKLQRFESGEK